MYNVPTIVCGSVAGCGLDEKRGATRATRDAIFLMDEKRCQQAIGTFKFIFHIFYKSNQIVQGVSAQFLQLDAGA